MIYDKCILSTILWLVQYLSTIRTYLYKLSVLYLLTSACLYILGFVNENSFVSWNKHVVLSFTVLFQAIKKDFVKFYKFLSCIKQTISRFIDSFHAINRLCQLFFTFFSCNKQIISRFIDSVHAINRLCQFLFSFHAISRLCQVL